MIRKHDITDFDIPDNWEIIDSGFQWVVYGLPSRKRRVIRHINPGNCFIALFVIGLILFVLYGASQGG